MNKIKFKNYAYLLTTSFLLAGGVEISIDSSHVYAGPDDDNNNVRIGNKRPREERDGALDNRAIRLKSELDQSAHTASNATVKIVNRKDSTTQQDNPLPPSTPHQIVGQQRPHQQAEDTSNEEPDLQRARLGEENGWIYDRGIPLLRQYAANLAFQMLPRIAGRLGEHYCGVNLEIPIRVFICGGQATHQYYQGNTSTAADTVAVAVIGQAVSSGLNYMTTPNPDPQGNVDNSGKNQTRVTPHPSNSNWSFVGNINMGRDENGLGGQLQASFKHQTPQ